MEAQWTVFLLLSQVLLAALTGFGSYWLSRKRSSGSSVESSERLQEEFRAFKRSVMGEWEDFHSKMRSLAGRMDRARRKGREEEEPAETNGAEPGGPESFDLAALNQRLLRARGVPL